MRIATPSSEVSCDAPSRLGEIRPPGLRGGVTDPGSRPFKAALMRMAFRALGRLPIRGSHAIGACAGRLVALLPTGSRRVTEINLGIAFPGLAGVELRRLVCNCLAHQGRTMAELGFMMTRPRRHVLALVRQVSGEQPVREAIDAGRGVILAGLHLGAWELVLAYCSTRYPMTTLFRPPRPRELGPWMRAARERFGTRMSPAGVKGAGAVLKALQKGEMVGIAPDQDAGDGAGIFVPLFGMLANTTMLPSRLLARTGALLVLAYAQRLPGGSGFHLHFVPASDEVYETDVLRSAGALNRDIERCVRALPEQWLWAYRRYRIRPVGLKSPYDGRITVARRP